ncbi:hypothetical protein IV505_14545 [Pseudomonas fulva]|nr:hypothetical protein [Pseudomonas fulva]MBF8780936.1 hypothetical protein [Pseudomonas fulva]
MFHFKSIGTPLVLTLALVATVGCDQAEQSARQMIDQAAESARQAIDETHQAAQQTLSEAIGAPDRQDKDTDQPGDTQDI